MVLAGGGLAVPATAMAAPVALEHELVALDDDPDGVDGRGITGRDDDDTRGDDGDWGADVRAREDPDGVYTRGGFDWGADVRAREDPDGVYTRGGFDPPVDEFGIQTRIEAGFDPPVDESGVQTRIEAGFDPSVDESGVQTRIEAGF
ncbi:hypothetical protein [Streptomyces sp. NPDC002205]|uniref:hypothetical protein n=1 Tax=Streptomyces sp. NPDC002205 TaxID=3154411 RepID=UPI00331F216B